ncbi:MAG: FAD-dependent oxidoreductase [Xenococcaceae cyanobacterium MO_207.B15]|nr:FAD-dependent oxidoreductase [Xenococcaceae cyanobacterium MO_207.B15]
MLKLTPSLICALATISFILPSASINALPGEADDSCTQANAQLDAAQEYDVIIFGDEIPGVMTAIKVKRELEKRNGEAKVALMTEGDTSRGIGGHLVRGGLAYLDRNQVPRDMRDELGTFGASSQLYQEFIDLTDTETIALDRFKATKAFENVFLRENIDLIGNVKLQSVATVGKSVCSLMTTNNGSFIAQQFIDATQDGKLAEMSGVEMSLGFAQIGLPDSSLSIGWVFEIYGKDIEQLKQIEAGLIERFLNKSDRQAQDWLTIASGDNLGKLADLERSFTDAYDRPAIMYQATPDSADVRALAFSVAYHGTTNSLFDLRKSKTILDRANIAVLDNRLSLNALLFDVDATQARELSNNGAKPTPEMIVITEEVTAFFQSLGIQRIEFMDELYIRTAGQISESMDDLTATKMSDGGVPEEEALGTFSYHLDARGGIAGLREKAIAAGVHEIRTVLMPTFNYGFRHTLPVEYENLAVLSPASGFGGLGTTAGRIVEFNVSVGEGLAIATAIANAEGRSLHSISNQEVKQALGYTPKIYGKPSSSWFDVFTVEKLLRRF